MNKILHRQKIFLQLLSDKKGIVNDPSSNSYASCGEIVAYIKEHSFYMMEEVSELILAIGNNDRAILKPWSIRHKELANKVFKTSDEVQEEAIDMLCFCMNICFAAGLTPDSIEYAYEKKWLENIARQERGY